MNLTLTLLSFHPVLLILVYLEKMSILLHRSSLPALPAYDSVSLLSQLFAKLFYRINRISASPRFPPPFILYLTSRPSLVLPLMFLCWSLSLLTLIVIIIPISTAPTSNWQSQCYCICYSCTAHLSCSKYCGYTSDVIETVITAYYNTISADWAVNMGHIHRQLINLIK